LPYRFGATRAPVPKPVTHELRGCSSMVEQQPSKLNTRVRFPSPAPMRIQAAQGLLATSSRFQPHRVHAAGSHPLRSRDSYTAYGRRRRVFFQRVALTAVRKLKAANPNAEIACQSAQGSAILPIAEPNATAMPAQHRQLANVIHARVLSSGRPARTRLRIASKADAKLPERAQTSVSLPTG
jgi:hypothetical protein